MKYQVYTFVMLVTVLTFATCQTFIEASVSIINSSGYVANVDRTLIGFTGIEIYVDANITVIQRANGRLIVQSDDDLMASIQREFHQGTLLISMAYMGLDRCNLTQDEVVESCENLADHIRQLHMRLNHYKKQDLS